MELGIKGNETRGEEVIKLLEMLGGKNCCYRLTGYNDKCFYYISYEYKYICNSYIGPDEINGYKIFSLDDFLEKYPYKVGDEVNIYIQNDDIEGLFDLEVAEITSMRWDPTRCRIVYKMKDINREFCVEDIKGKVDDDEKNLFHTTNEYEEIVENSFQGGYEKCKLDIQSNGYELPEGYHFTDENGNVIGATKILIKKNSPTYPTTYAECCKVIGYGGIISFAGLADEEENLYGKFIALKRCRDAYWKIAGEELGLDKPWEPKNELSTRNKIYDMRTYCNNIEKGCTEYPTNRLLSFPTEEMRNAFYNNFKDLIESCKELL